MSKLKKDRSLDEFFGRRHRGSERADMLRQIYDAPKADVESFFDAVSQHAAEDLFPGAPKETSRKLISGKPDAVKGPKNLTEYISGYVRIWTGWHDDAFVWHLEPAQIRRPWKAPEERILYAVAKTMNEYLPKRILVDIFLPPRDWEIKTFTFKALGLKDEWSIQEEDLKKLTKSLFDVLTPMV